MYYMPGTVLGNKDVLQHEENMVLLQEAPRMDTENHSLKHLRSSPETRLSVTFLGTSELHPGVRMGSLLTGFGNGSPNLFTDYKNFPNYTELHILLLFLLENEKGIYFGGLL